MMAHLGNWVLSNGFWDAPGPDSHELFRVLQLAFYPFRKLGQDHVCAIEAFRTTRARP